MIYLLKGTIMPTISVLTAILPLIGVLIGASLQYLFGRTLESQRHLTLQKGQAYADYFKAVAMLSTQGRSKDALSLVADAKTRVCIYGSVGVVQRLGSFERAGARVSPGKGQAAITELLKTMRKDMGVSGNRIDEDDLHRILFGPPQRRTDLRGM